MYVLALTAGQRLAAPHDRLPTSKRDGPPIRGYPGVTAPVDRGANPPSPPSYGPAPSRHGWDCVGCVLKKVAEADRVAWASGSLPVQTALTGKQVCQCHPTALLGLRAADSWNVHVPKNLSAGPVQLGVVYRDRVIPTPSGRAFPLDQRDRPPLHRWTVPDAVVGEVLPRHAAKPYEALALIRASPEN